MTVVKSHHIPKRCPHSRKDTRGWKSWIYIRILLTTLRDPQGCGSLCLLTSVSLLESGAWEFQTLLHHSGTERKLRALCSPVTQSTIPLCGWWPAGLQASHGGLSEILKLKERTTFLSPCKSLGGVGKEQDSQIISILFSFSPSSYHSLHSTKVSFAFFIEGWGRDGRDGWLNSLSSLLLM